jgi:phosphohistidine phosphatase
VGVGELRLLVIVRHAKAEVGDGSDQRRALSYRGRKQSAALGLEFKTVGFVPDAALVSRAKRTRETYEYIAANAGWELEPVLSDQLYLAYTPEALELIQQTAPAVKKLIVVGHEPTMSALAYKLACPGSAPDAVSQVRRGLGTAGRAVVQVSGPWSDVGRGGTTLLTGVVGSRL